MHPKRKRRLFAVIAIIVGVGIAGGLTVWSLQQNMLFFISPTDVVQQDLPAGRQFRLGGLVEPGSVARADDSLEVEFVVTDGQNRVEVRFDDILPDLFQEGQGVIARGAFNEQREFVATEVLAKHDENYMPPEVADALEKAGHPMGKESGNP